MLESRGVTTAWKGAVEVAILHMVWMMMMRERGFGLSGIQVAE